MLALIRMDWTLNRRVLLQLSPLFLLQSLIVCKGTLGIHVLFFYMAALAMVMPLFQNLRDTIEPFVCALPVSRGRIVLARYASALMGLAIALTLALLLGRACQPPTYWWVEPVSMPDLVTGLAVQVLVLVVGMFLYLPFHFRFGGDLGMGLFAGALVTCTMAWIGIRGWGGFDADGTALMVRLLNDAYVGVGAAVGAVLLGVGSLGLSLASYRRRPAARQLSPVLPILLLCTVLGMVAWAAHLART